MKNLSAIILLFIANSVSGVAQGISMLAIPWYFAKEGEMGNFGLIYVLANIIALFWAPYSGTFIDRYNRKHLFLIITLTIGSLLFLIAGLGYYLGGLPWYMVAFIFMVTFFNYNIHYPNLYAFVQEITEPANYGKVTSYIEVQGQLTSIMAGAFAAMLLDGTTDGTWNLFGIYVDIGFDVAPWQIYEIFLMDGSTYILAFFTIYFIRYVPLAKRSREEGNTWVQLKIGFNYLKKHPYIFLFGVASYSIFVTVLIEGFYLGALYVNNHLYAGGDVYAASDMYYAIGAVFAGASIHWVFRQSTLPMAIIIMTMLTCGLFGVLALTQSVIVYYAMLFIMGVANAGTRVLRTTYLFSHIPNQVYGRATSVFTLSNISFRIFFLSLFTLPFFQEGHAVVYAFGILSVFLFLSGGVLIRYYSSFVNKG